MEQSREYKGADRPAEPPELPPRVLFLLRAVCPRCGGVHVRRSRKKSLWDHALGLIRIRVYRCEDCNHRHHGWKLLKQLALPVKPAGPRREWRRAGLLHRYRSWRIREGRNAGRVTAIGLLALAAVSVFFYLLWHSHAIPGLGG